MIVKSITAKERPPVNIKPPFTKTRRDKQWQILKESQLN